MILNVTLTLKSARVMTLAIWSLQLKPMSWSREGMSPATESAPNIHKVKHLVGSVRRKTCQVLRRAQRLRHLLRHDSPRKPQRVNHKRDTSDTCTNGRVAVACSLQSRNSDAAPLNRKKCNNQAVVVGRCTLFEETLSATQTRETNWDLPMSAPALELQKNGNVEEDEKTESSRVPC